ncbi:aminotransferase class I/II-fold pyridoxal phosphate-dependent enzyme [Methylovirgula sp. 4M-Z18]|uniref:aminotransferase class I/II-fold pyridoxal phosphate-dependent enzyme n=1 Tax=Methylovirgula sp. 4M-Z18 TaxID=2293567 RepID=UPI000E2F3155|nr:aminotransferase class I/II-fold pyridoxal phosphate-dependent enzyme [Methylovirgula sp. 4M-Z18]RFB79552.1 aminotransferase class I/II-fold pyridoxal phosphate-dependent enzyme [Methylovirgula sp. 4M-Z18]
MGRHQAVKQVSSTALADYYSASQLRNDRWTALKYAAHDLVSSADRPKTSAIEKARDLLDTLEPIETYWSFPGRRGVAGLIELLVRRDYGAFSDEVDRIADSLATGSYRRPDGDLDDDDDHTKAVRKPFFEVLVVENSSSEGEEAERDALRAMRRPDDAFVYETVFVNTFEDALIAILFNHNIQSVVVRYDFAYRSKNSLKVLQRILSRVNKDYTNISREEHGPELCRAIRRVRPELDVYLVTDRSVEEIAGQDLGGCSRVFYNREDYLELHLNVLRGIASRFNTPFFTALKEYSKQPTGVFHAMPISRGKSITRSNWIRDMVEFYGMNIFLAETSATSGGLDSLLDPHGPIKKAQELASRAFGSKHTFFATNGTSTCNKIVVQAVVRPGDIVLVDRDCHKSHHYGMVLAGAHVVYLDSYPLSEYSMYGAVPLREIKHKLLELKKAGKLHRVRMLLLTNCTFDGLIYNVERVMEECLAIKPDLVFLWDEAWFAFARFGPTYRQRTAMHAAATLAERFAEPKYREAYAKQKVDYSKMSDEEVLNTRLMPDPAKARVRVYATQSTHKTLTSLRQGSMIHVYDQDFKGEIEASFHEAYMTHTSTSPNYQIIASLDVGRRQVELEGFELVQKQVEAAMAVRKSIAQHPILSKYFHVLTVKDMIPAEYRESGVETYWDPEHGWNDAWDAWEKDEFALDATRITLAIGGTGVDGDTFKNSVLMDKFGIQINKTSRNTVLFMTNIGTTRSSIAYLIEVLVQIARDLDAEQDYANPTERKVFHKKVHALTKELPPLPDFSRFHATFSPQDGTTTTEGDIRSAFFLSYDEAKCEYVPLNGRSMDKAMDEGREFVSTSFVIPYPPGFPILVPGQVISHEILAFMRALDVKEIHGYRADLGLRVFTQAALDQRTADQAKTKK